MGKLFRSRLAVSSVVALLIVVLLIETFISTLLYISSLQMQNVGEGTKPVEQLSEAVREKVDAELVGSEAGSLKVRVKNTGLITLTITQALLTQADGSLKVVDINPDRTIVPLEEAEISIPYSGSYALGLQTERGNVFPISTGTVLQQTSYTVAFYVRDAAGNPVSGATLVFNGASYSDAQSATVPAGAYPLSTGTVPSGYAFSRWEASGSVSVASTTSSPTTSTVSGSGLITMRLAYFDFSLSVSPGSGSATAGGSATATATVSLVSGSPTTVTLSTSGLPSGATVSFSPSSGTPTFTSTMTISTSSSTPAGTYTITVTASGGGITRTATYALTVSPATATVTFSVSGMSSDASGTVLTVDGASYVYSALPKSFIWDVGSTRSFSWSDPVNAGTGKRYGWVSTSGLSTAKSGSVTVPSGGGSITASYKTQYQLTVNVNPSGGGTTSPSPGTYWCDRDTSVSITATANSGYAFDTWTGDASGTSSSTSVTMNAPKTVTANFFTFSISVSPSSGSTAQGGSVSATVTVTYVSGVSSKTISLSASGLPSGASASFSPSSVTISPSSSTATSTMTITTSTSTPTGTYTVTFQGSGGGVTKSTTYTLTITIFDFTISVSPSSLPVCRGAGKTATVAVTLVGGSGTVSLSASGLPSGVTASFSPQSGTPAFTSTLTISASSSASLGSYTVTITGSGGGVTKSAALTLYVNDFSIGVSPSSGSTAKPASGYVTLTATVTVRCLSGSGSSVTVTLSGEDAPSGASVTLSPSILTVSPGSSATSTMTIYVYPTINTPPSPVSVTFNAYFMRHGSYAHVSQIADWQGLMIEKNILSVNGSTYKTTQLPLTLTYNIGLGAYAIKVRGDSDCGGSETATYSLSVSSSSVKLSVAWYSEATNLESSYYAGKGYSYDVRYQWTSASGLMADRTGTITLPPGGSVAAYYGTRLIMVAASMRPAGAAEYPPGTVTDTGKYSGNWYYEDCSLTSNPNTPYYGWGEWHRDDDTSAVYSASQTVKPWDPMKLTADFYPRVRVYVENYDNVPLPGMKVYIVDAWITADSNAYACRYVHPYFDVPLNLNNPASYSYGGETYTLKYYQWGDGVASASRTIFSISKPADLTATYNSVFLFKNLDYSWEAYGWQGDMYVEAWGYVKNIYGQPVGNAQVWVKFRIKNDYGSWIDVRAPPTGAVYTDPQGYFYVENDEESLPGNSHQLLGVTYAAIREGYNDKGGNDMLVVKIGSNPPPP